MLDLGRPPEARFEADFRYLSETPVTHEDIAHVCSRISPFGADNRAGIEQTLHRISAIRNRQGKIVGLTCRVGRAVYGTIDIVLDVLRSGKSICLLGRPGVGKTTMLRECARILSEDRKRVVIVDTSNEIAGDSDIPHPGIGLARRMQVADPALQHAVMIEAVENHMPRSHRHRRNRHRSRSGRGADDCRTRRHADRHGARTDARKSADESDAVGPRRRHQRRNALRRRSAPARHAQNGPRAQGSADVRRASWRFTIATAWRFTRTSPKSSTHSCAAISRSRRFASARPAATSRSCKKRTPNRCRSLPNAYEHHATFTTKSATNR